MVELHEVLHDPYLNLRQQVLGDGECEADRADEDTDDREDEPEEHLSPHGFLPLLQHLVRLVDLRAVLLEVERLELREGLVGPRIVLERCF